MTAGFYLTARRLELAQISRGDVFRFAARNLPDDLFTPDGRLEPEALAREVAALIEEHRLTVDEATVSVPGASTWLVSQPARRRDPMWEAPEPWTDREAVLSCADRAPILQAVGPLALDVQPVPPPAEAGATWNPDLDEDAGTGTVQALASALPHETAARIGEAFQLAGITVRGMEPRACSYLRGALALGRIPAVGRDPKRWGAIFLEPGQATLTSWAGERPLAWRTVPLPDSTRWIEAIRVEVTELVECDRPTTWILAGPPDDIEALRSRLKLPTPPQASPRKITRRLVPTPQTSLEALGAALWRRETFPVCPDLRVATPGPRRWLGLGAGHAGLLAGLAVALLVMLGWSWALDHEIARLDRQVHLLSVGNRLMSDAMQQAAPPQQTYARFASSVIQHSARNGEAFRLLQDQIPPEVWLDGISVDASGSLAVRGNALNSRAVARFAHDLAETGQVTGVRTQVNGGSPLRFSLDARLATALQ